MVNMLLIFYGLFEQNIAQTKHIHQKKIPQLREIFLILLFYNLTNLRVTPSMFMTYTPGGQEAVGTTMVWLLLYITF